MATQSDTEYIGRIGKIIFYERLGDFLIRTVPKQTANSIRSASAFGRAASKAKDLRLLLSPLIPYSKDRRMQYRLDAAMRLFLAESRDEMDDTSQPDSLTGFRFVDGASFNDYIAFTITIDEYDAGRIRVGIPAIKPAEAIAAPEGTASVQIRVMAAAFHPNNGQNSPGEPHLFEIPYTQELQDPAIVDLYCTAVAGSIVVVAASIGFRIAGQPSYPPHKLAAEILQTIRL